MSVKVDETGRRSVAVETEIVGTPEQVWQAIATGPGVSAWFVPTEIEGRQGGRLSSDFGPAGTATATITAWEPPRRFAAESELAPGTPPMATEWTVEARNETTCVVRVVHSLFTEADQWDDELESTESGWPGFFRVLNSYLRYFAGQPAATVQHIAMSERPVADVWQSLLCSLSDVPLVDGGVVRSATVPPIAGAVEHFATERRHLVLHVDEPCPGTMLFSAHAMGPGACVVLAGYFYGEHGGPVTRDRAAWQSLLDTAIR